MDYLLLKFIHIISATILFGTGIGTAFFMLMAYISKNTVAISVTARHVVLADWIFTTPAIIIQPITGIWLMLILHYPFNSIWFFLVMSLYFMAGICWLPVVFIQYRMRKKASFLSLSEKIPKSFHILMRWWIGLGVVAFTSLIAVYWLMISKLGLSIPVYH